MARVDSLLLLGVVLDHHLLFTPHVINTLAHTAQSAYALKVLKFHGLSMECLDAVCMGTLVARVLYASRVGGVLPLLQTMRGFSQPLISL